LVTAFGAIANGGTLMQPRLVKSTFDADGRETRRFDAKAVRQVVSPATARTLSNLLTSVVESGTGRFAAIPGYAVAGKTGTAQKLDPATRRYSHAPGVLSFVGFAPADEPRFAMLVMLDEPRNEKWGSEAAAPIFGAIGREILRYLEVPPRDVQPVQIVTGPPAEPVSPARMRLVSTAEAAQPDGARRMPEPGGCFVAVPGFKQDGRHFIPDAIRRGAAVVVTEGEPVADLPVPQVLVPSVRVSLARLAGAFYGHPSRQLALVGITGTNGKTT